MDGWVEREIEREIWYRGHVNNARVDRENQGHRSNQGRCVQKPDLEAYTMSQNHVQPVLYWKHAKTVQFFYAIPPHTTTDLPHFIILLVFSYS